MEMTWQRGFVIVAAIMACGPATPGGDAGGDGDGDADTLPDVEVDDPPAMWCATQWPIETTTQVGVPTEPLFVRVRVEGVTPTGGADPALLVELGHGSSEEPPPMFSTWYWSRAEHNARCDGCPTDQDEFMGTVTPDAAGDLIWAARVRYGDGMLMYCDRADGGRTGSRDGWTVSDAPRLTVTERPSLQVVSLNLRCLLDEWDRRLPIVVEALADIGPDVVGFQEACAEPGASGRDNLVELVSALEARTGLTYSAVRTVTHRAWDTYDEGLALVSPHELREHRAVDLPAGAFPRKVLLARVTTPAGEVVAATTHLDHQSAETRAAQAAALVAVLDELVGTSDDALVLTGDFNEGPSGSVHPMLRGAGFVDLWDALRPGEPGPTFPADDPQERIDSIWLRPGGSSLVPVTIERILENPVDGVTGSDHLGLWGVVR
jgi:endonuclease/exonuclease/phosphatase family metal-dependent hydrolase